ARQYYREALAMEREHPEIVPEGDSSTALFLGGVLDDAEARERSLVRTLAERLEASRTSISTAQAHNALGVHYFNTGEYRAAYAEYTAAERIVARERGELDPARNALRHNLAYAAAQMGRLRDAERHARTGLDGTLRGELGPEREAGMRLALAMALFLQDEVDGAIGETRQAHRLFERTQGASGAGTLRTRFSLAVLLSEADRLDEALVVARRTEAGHRANGTLRESEGLMVQASIAGLRYATGETREGLASLRRLARGLPADATAPTRRVVLALTGDALLASGDAAAAEPLLRRALVAARESHPDAHRNVLHSRLVLGRTLSALGRHAEARPHLEAARGHIPRITFPSTVPDVDAEIDRLLAMGQVADRG
ncbi:MAG: tetratricopeptide repeat protein, partial [Bacteroidota bacterium]